METPGNIYDDLYEVLKSRKHDLRIQTIFSIIMLIFLPIVILLQLKLTECLTFNYVFWSFLIFYFFILIGNYFWYSWYKKSIELEIKKNYLPDEIVTILKYI